MQIVDYVPADETPAQLVISDEGNLRYFDLEQDSFLSFTLDNRHCAGSIQNDSHIPCDKDETPRCTQHTSTWICARCTGTCLKDEMDCHQQHAVYLAAFAPDTFKVGVTKEARINQRLAEQGADRAAQIYSVKNGRIAREIEADIATEIPDRVQIQTKIQGLPYSVNKKAWSNLLTDYDPLETFNLSYGFSVDTQPIPTTMATGYVEGTKGRLLILSRENTLYAIDLRDLIGYEVRNETSSQNRQSSLQTFG
ncbi:MAG: DUF2797 domain-containing protein [Halobacteriaceae archaeon]